MGGKEKRKKKDPRFPPRTHYLARWLYPPLVCHPALQMLPLAPASHLQRGGGGGGREEEERESMCVVVEEEEEEREAGRRVLRRCNLGSRPPAAPLCLLVSPFPIFSPGSGRMLRDRRWVFA